MSLTGMHNLFKTKGQKKKKDDVEGQSSAWTLKYIINVFCTFFFIVELHLLLFIIHKQIKQLTNKTSYLHLATVPARMCDYAV